MTGHILLYHPGFLGLCGLVRDRALGPLRHISCKRLHLARGAKRHALWDLAPHDLSMIRHISQRVAVMYLGRIMELANHIEIYENPLHPYTQALLSAVPTPNPVSEATRKRVILTGDVPSPVNPPAGCRFHTRCPFVLERCRKEEPLLEALEAGHSVACHRKQDMPKLIREKFG